MTSAEIRRSFLDFFREKQHTIVPSSSLLPDAPNLLFTNAGMNQFVPIFLGQAPCPYRPARAADTQKCIRAGGKHNDLEDVGFDTYHHTFFEMLGNWSFGDYFKKEAIAWAWELVVGRWNFPASRIYATVYQPGPGDPASFDQEAHDEWAKVFTAAGLDPAIHIVNGNKKDNFWMMGDTGPCGPCSELHVYLGENPVELSIERQKEAREGVNSGSSLCIEIWNLVFIQFNANPDGSFVDLPAKHVDTGMGFERVTSMIQGTNGFTDFNAKAISNYDTDVFRPLFLKIEELTGESYNLNPQGKPPGFLEQHEKNQIAFRVIADHIRTLSFSIADGIRPSNEGRGYVLRRILRRAVKYGRNLGLREPFLAKLVPVLGEMMGEIFPEVISQAATVQTTLIQEEESFFRTLERGLELLDQEIMLEKAGKSHSQPRKLSGSVAFTLHDTYGFPIDLTQLIAREHALDVDMETFEGLMEQQKNRGKAAQKKTVIQIGGTEIEAVPPTRFVGFSDENLVIDAAILGLNPTVEEASVAVDKTPFYAAMGGQVSDVGSLKFRAEEYQIVDVQKRLDVYVHVLDRPLGGGISFRELSNQPVRLSVNRERRARIEAHHSGTHVLHWALRKVLGPTIGQKGSYVGPDRLRFDFSHGAAMTPAQVAEVEALVNERIAEDVPVSWDERPYAQVKGDPSILQFFGDKYGETVRVVSIGDFSRELCGGTHVRRSGQIGYFKILSEGAIAAGIRRIEAASGVALAEQLAERVKKQDETLAGLKARKADLPALTAIPPDATPEILAELVDQREDALHAANAAVVAHEKEQAKAAEADFQRRAAGEAVELIAGARTFGDIPFIAHAVSGGPAAYLPVLADALKARWQGVAVLASAEAGKVALLCAVAPAFTKKIQAGKVIQAIAPLVGGKGGGRPELAQGGGTNPDGVAAALAKAEELVKAVG
jgi:alanyl-tRNA synthetase